MSSGFTEGRSFTLDVLRSIAIALVIARHGISVPGLEAPSSGLLRAVYNIAANGWLGVDLFFVLSGFLLSSQIFRVLERHGALDVPNFLARRFLRTAPAFLVVLLILWAGFGAETFGTVGVLDLTVLAENLIFIQDYTGSPILVTFWSLATEEKFYLLMALAVPALARARSRAVLAVLGGAAVWIAISRALSYAENPIDNYAAFFWAYRAPFHFALDGLILGVLAGYLHIRVQLVVSPRRFMAAGALALAILLSANWAADGAAHGMLFAIPAFSLLVMFAVLGAPNLDQVATNQRLRHAAMRLADLSYSIYLVHYPVAKYVFTTGPGSVSDWIAYLLLTGVMAIALHLSVERPCLRLRGRSRARLSAIPSS